MAGKERILTECRVHEQSWLKDIDTAFSHPVIYLVPLHALVMAFVQSDGSACSVVRPPHQYIGNMCKWIFWGAYVRPHCMGRILRSALHCTVWRRMFKQCSEIFDQSAMSATQ